MTAPEHPTPITLAEIRDSILDSLRSKLRQRWPDWIPAELDPVAADMANNAAQGLGDLAEIATAAVRWATADRVADASADLVNTLEREERAWSKRWESKGADISEPSLTGNTVRKIRKELDVAKLALADACAVEAAAAEALYRAARQIAPPPATTVEVSR